MRMKKSNVSMTVKSMSKKMAKGEISFDYPIQRPAGQWSDFDKSLLIHSLIIEFPVPPLYVTDQVVGVEDGYDSEKKIAYVLDGKQRMTTILGYLKNEFKLHEETPVVKFEEDGEEFVVANKSFDDLEDEIKDAITDYSLTLYKLEDITDSQIEDLFYRLNNGVSLTKQHQSKAKMGKEWALRLKDMQEHNLMDIASFTPLQRKKGDDDLAIVQTMMMLDDSHNWSSVASNEIVKYIDTFKGDTENKIAILEKIKGAFDYLFASFNDTDKLVLKKVHFPMTVQLALHAMDKGVDKKVFDLWREQFRLSYQGRSKDYIKTDYKSYCGQGSVKKHMAIGRLESMTKHFDDFLVKFEKGDFDKVEKEIPVIIPPVEEIETPVVEQPIIEETPVEEETPVVEVEVKEDELKVVEETPVVKDVKESKNSVGLAVTSDELADNVADEDMQDLLDLLED